jgi:hypothetical protein
MLSNKVVKSTKHDYNTKGSFIQSNGDSFISIKT